MTTVPKARFYAARVNDNGLKQIADALEKFHIPRRHYNTLPMLYWHSFQAEGYFLEGKGFIFKIPKRNSKTGTTVTVAITEEGYIFEESDIDAAAEFRELKKWAKQKKEAKKLIRQNDDNTK